LLLGTFAPFAIAAMASTPAIVSGGGGIDISIGPLMAVISIVFVTILLPSGLGDPWFAIPIMLLLGYLFLQEEIGPHRLLACGVGFVGTLLVIQPSFRDVGYYALLPLGVAVIFSFFILTTRKIAKQTDPIGLQAVNGVMATGVLLPVVLAGNFLAVPGLTLSASTGQDFSLLLGIGLVGTLAHLLMTWSLRFAPSASVAPMQYLEIPVATAIGLVIFGDLPNTLASAGIAVTVAAGLYVVSYEHLGQWRRARSFAPPSIPPSRRPKPVAAE
ncbi:MAG: DMT family transporter, partial [Marinibacterium sp.]